MYIILYTKHNKAYRLLILFQKPLNEHDIHSPNYGTRDLHGLMGMCLTGFQK